MNDLINLVVKLVVVIGSILLVRWVKPLIQEKIESIKDEKLREALKEAVEAFEQTIQESGMGEIKKEKVLDFIQNWISNKGYDITYDELEIILESTVYEMNNKGLSTISLLDGKDLLDTVQIDE